MRPIQVGITHEHTTEITQPMSAEMFGNSGFPVLATPALVGLAEECAIRLLHPFLDEGEGTVGTKIAIEHLAATPLHWNVTITATLAGVDRKRLSFTLKAHDGCELIAMVTHDRYLVNLGQFREKLAQKSGTVAS